MACERVKPMYITRLASNEIFSPSNKIHREVGRTRDLSAPLYICTAVYGCDAGVLFRKDHRLKVPDNTVLREMLDSGSKAVTGDMGRLVIQDNFIICTYSLI